MIRSASEAIKVFCIERESVLLKDLKRGLLSLSVLLKDLKRGHLSLRGDQSLLHIQRLLYELLFSLHKKRTHSVVRREHTL